jgi:hypothetical protein
MGELANYSIETDQLVWLAFKDGHSLRVPVAQLARYLAPRDLQKVRKAMNLRKDFFRQNMPKALVAVVAFGLITLVVAGQQVLALLGRRSTPTLASPTHTEIVRNITPQSPEPSPAPSPATSPVAAVVARRTAARAKPVPTLPPAASSAVAGATAVLVTPIPAAPTASPAPSPAASPSPSPSPSPTPSTPPAGQVLGDSTGPESSAPVPQP